MSIAAAASSCACWSALVLMARSVYGSMISHLLAGLHQGGGLGVLRLLQLGLREVHAKGFRRFSQDTLAIKLGICSTGNGLGLGSPQNAILVEGGWRC